MLTPAWRPHPASWPAATTITLLLHTYCHLQEVKKSPHLHLYVMSDLLINKYNRSKNKMHYGCNKRKVTGPWEVFYERRRYMRADTKGERNSMKARNL